MRPGRLLRRAVRNLQAAFPLRSEAEKAFKDALAQYPADHHAESALRALREKPVSAGL